jgi:hypothetical protein
MSQTLSLDKIRKLILLRNSIKHITPSDCRLISLAIQKKTQKNISETTLKRLFGFAQVKNKFSKYTVNALLEYVEESEGYDLVAPEILQPSATVNESLSNIQLNALDITYSTLKNIKNRSTVPYSCTIPRIFANFDFEYFYSSDYSFTVFASQAGYGKSILLSHLVQNQFLEKEARYKKDIILFVTAGELFDGQDEPYSLENRIKSKIGLKQNSNLLDYFRSKNQKQGIKFVIIIDGFSDLPSDKISKPEIFNKLITLITSIGDENFVKVIFSMRSTMWSRFYDRIKNIPFIRKMWFPGTYFNIRIQSNIPPLAISEIEEILEKIDPDRYKKVDPSLKAKLNYPFYIQWYYLLKEEFPSFDSFTNIVFFEIIDRFIHEKIYNTTYATEKVLFCRKLIILSEFGKGTKMAPKLELIADLSNFKNAYRELLAEGILMEEKQEEDGFVIDTVRFVHPHIFEYFLFIELLSNAKNKMDEAFFEYVNNLYAGNSVRFQLLQWSARLLIIKSDFRGLEPLLGRRLSNYERTYLIYFIAENLNYRLQRQPSLKSYLQKDELHELMMRHIVHFDFADSCYKDAISSLLSISNNNRFTFLYLLILSIYDCLGLNKDDLQQRLLLMEPIAAEGETWFINPYKILQCVSHVFNGQTYHNEALFNAIEDFKAGKLDIKPNAERLPSYEEMLTFMLMGAVNVFYGNAKEALRLIDALINYYPRLATSESIASSYIFSLTNFQRARADIDEQSSLVKKITGKFFDIQSAGNSTPYIQTIYLASKSFESRNNGDFTAAIMYAERCIEVFRRNDLALFELAMSQMIACIYKDTGNEDKKNEHMYERLRLTEQKKIHCAIFHRLAE